MSSPQFGLDPRSEAPGEVRPSRFRIALRVLVLAVLLYFFVLPLWTSSLTSFRKHEVPGFGSTLLYAYSTAWEVAGIIFVCFACVEFYGTVQRLDVKPSWKGWASGGMLWLAATLSSMIAIYAIQLASFLKTGHAVQPMDLSRMFKGVPLAVLVVFFLVNPWFEELLVRGYLMTEIMDITGSAKAAVVVSIVVQTGYHLYQGWLNTVEVGIVFTVFALYFAKTKKLFPVIFAHTLMDLFGGLYQIEGWRW